MENYKQNRKLNLGPLDLDTAPPDVIDPSILDEHPDAATFYQGNFVVADNDNEKRSAKALLAEALPLLEDRTEKYGDPNDAFERIAKFLGLALKRETTAKEAALIMALVKIQRINECDPDDPHFKDSILDCINYLAICWEVS